MNIDILDPGQGFTLCVEKPRQQDQIWKAPSGTGEQLFRSLRYLYVPPSFQHEENDLPFVEYKT
jgi:hypothetical protein